MEQVFDILINNGALDPTFDIATNIYYNEATQSFAFKEDLDKIIASSENNLPAYKVGADDVVGSVLNKSKTYNDDIETKTTTKNVGESIDWP